MRLACLVIPLLVLSLSAKAQYILQLKNRKNGKVVERYYPGHTIAFHTKDWPDEIEGIIDSIGPQVFFVRNMPYADSMVSAIVIKPENCNWRMNGAKLMIAGALYPGIELFNNVNVYNDISVRKSTVIAGALLFTTGYILYRANHTVYPIGKKYYLKTI